MRAIKAKKIRHAMNLLLPQFGQQVSEACAVKFRMPNRYGEPQHRRINPKRQFKKAISRMGFVGGKVPGEYYPPSPTDKGGVLLPNP